MEKGGLSSDQIAALSSTLTPTQILQVQSKLARSQQNVEKYGEIETSTVLQELGVQLYEVKLDSGYDQFTPFEISFPFKGIWVYEASDTTTNAKLHLNSKKIPHILNGIPIRKNFNANFERTVGIAYLTAPVQVGKILYIVVVADGKIDPGLTISQNAGGLAINEGSAVSTRVRTGLTLTTLAASVIAPADLNRNNETLQNHTGQTLWLGGSTVTDDAGSSPGIRFDPSDTFVWKNTSALYAYNPGATLNDAKVSRNREI